MDNILLNSLKRNYIKHDTIIVGVDFDDTIFTTNPLIKDRCKKVVDLIEELKRNYNVVLCLNTVADKQSIAYKEAIMDLQGIKPDFINESPIKKWGECSKPYFNIYIDDKSGINEIISLLEKINKTHLLNL